MPTQNAKATATFYKKISIFSLKEKQKEEETFKQKQKQKR